MHESQFEQGLTGPQDEDSAPASGGRDGDHPGSPSLADIFDVQMAQLVVLQRIYDVQMAILSENSPTQADFIYEGHENGQIFGSNISWDQSQ